MSTSNTNRPLRPLRPAAALRAFKPPFILSQPSPLKSSLSATSVENSIKPETFSYDLAAPQPQIATVQKTTLKNLAPSSPPEAVARLGPDGFRQLEEQIVEFFPHCRDEIMGPIDQNFNRVRNLLSEAKRQGLLRSTQVDDGDFDDHNENDAEEALLACIQQEIDRFEKLGREVYFTIDALKKEESKAENMSAMFRMVLERRKQRTGR